MLLVDAEWAVPERVPFDVVFDDELAASHFLRVALKEMERARVEVPLWVSDQGVLAQQGPVGAAWLSPAAGNLPAASVADSMTRPWRNTLLPQ